MQTQTQITCCLYGLVETEWREATRELETRTEMSHVKRNLSFYGLKCIAVNQTMQLLDPVRETKPIPSDEVEI